MTDRARRVRGELAREVAVPAVPSVVGPIFGYRLWWIGSDGLLRSLNRAMDRVYPPRGVVEAVCGQGHREPPPVLECTCGIYAWKDLPAIRAGEDGVGPRPPAIAMDCVLVGPRWAEAAGLVQLWGKVIEHDGGYRAERASVAALISFEDDRVIAQGNFLGYYESPPPWYVRTLREIAARYEVPLLTLTEARKALRSPCALGRPSPYGEPITDEDASGTTQP